MATDKKGCDTIQTPPYLMSDVKKGNEQHSTPHITVRTRNTSRNHSPPSSVHRRHARLPSSPATTRAPAASHPLEKSGEEMDVVSDLGMNSLSWRDVSSRRAQVEEVNDRTSVHPPSFAQSEFETIIRRQKNNPHGLKIFDIPSRFPTLDNDWEFAGWGSMRYLELNRKDIEEAKAEMKPSIQLLDQFRVSSIAANAVVGSVFYSFPPVAAASGIFSPIALTVACLLLFLYRPVMLELGHSARSNGSNYTYLLQFSSRALALVAAGITLLDATATTTVSAATASAYLSGEFSSLPIPLPVISICFILAITIIALVNTRDSTSLTLSFFFFHAVTMAILMVFSTVSWAKRGSDILTANWAGCPTNIPREMFFGICIAFLGISGFECTPSYVEMVAPEKYSAVISTLIYSVIILNGPLMLLVYANLPSDRILFGTNILSILAQEVGGRWLRLLLVIDAMTVLCGGMATGIFTACNLMRTLTNDGVLPKIFLRPMPLTGQPFIAPLFFLFACLAMYSTSRFKLSTISAVFSVTVLSVLLLYPVSNILLKFNRDRLPRKFRASLSVTLLALVATVTVLAGNLVLSPVAIGLFASYFVFILAGLFIVKSQAKIARVVIWLYGQSEFFRNFKLTRGLDALCVKIIRSTRRHPICVWVKGDDIYHLVEYILYIRRNEPTGRIIFLHAYQDVQDIPSELGPNVKILDEAFPAITLDLTFVQGTFGPELVAAAGKKMNVPRSRMFASCFGANHPHSLAEYRGLRLIHH